VLDGLAEGLGGPDRDERRDDDEQEALDDRGDVLELLVAERVARVGRSAARTATSAIRAASRSESECAVSARTADEPVTRATAPFAATADAVRTTPSQAARHLRRA